MSLHNDYCRLAANLPPGGVAPSITKARNCIARSKLKQPGFVVDKKLSIGDLKNFAALHSKEKAVGQPDKPYVELVGGLLSENGQWTFLNSGGKIDYRIMMTTSRLMLFG